MTPRNLAQLKRFLKPGMVLMRSHSEYRPEPHPVTVKRLQGNAFTVLLRSEDGSKEAESWHNYEKAAAYSFQGDGFTVNIEKWLGKPGTVTYRYTEASQ